MTFDDWFGLENANSLHVWDQRDHYRACWERAVAAERNAWEASVAGYRRDLVDRFGPVAGSILDAIIVRNRVRAMTTREGG